MPLPALAAPFVAGLRVVAAGIFRTFSSMIRSVGIMRIFRGASRSTVRGVSARAKVALVNADKRRKDVEKVISKVSEVAHNGLLSGVADSLPFVFGKQRTRTVRKSKKIGSADASMAYDILSIDKGMNEALDNLVKVVELDLEVVIGLFGDKANLPDETGTAPVDRGIWNEFGTVRGVPSRPFVLATIADNFFKICKITENAVCEMMEGRDPIDAYADVGRQVHELMWMKMLRGPFVRNARSTLLRKRRENRDPWNKPLLETQEMFANLRWAVVWGERGTAEIESGGDVSE